MTPTLDRPTGPYRRVLVKITGESFCKPGGFGIDADELTSIAGELAGATRAGAQLAVVVGGGNLIRGAELARAGAIRQATADQMGMLGTVINALALRERLAALGTPTEVMSAAPVRGVVDPFDRTRGLALLDRGTVLVLAGGTGHPFFTTDTTAALRAAELECQVLLKATKVDGVYSADPRKDPKATRFDRLTFADALAKGLKVMDATAFALCQERGVPILVFEFSKPGNIRRAAAGEPIGTLVHP
ncbi:MAG: UMP kinase [Phycisphaerae bacterium]|nr:UMP kinase [Phycisphaerae bacterium]